MRSTYQIVALLAVMLGLTSLGLAQEVYQLTSPPTLGQLVLPVPVEIYSSEADFQDEAVRAEEIESQKQEVAQQRKEDREHDASDLAAQWLAARSADSMVTWTIIQSLIGLATIGAALYSLKLTRDALIGETRPIMISDTPIMPNSIMPGGAPLLITWKVINHGKGVGFVKSYRLFLGIHDKAQEMLKEKAAMYADAMHWPIASEGFWHVENAELTADNLWKVGVQQGDLPLYFYGEVTYLASSKKSYVMRCAFKWEPNRSRFASHADDDWWS